MYFTGINPHDIPVRDVLGFNEEIEEIFEIQKDLIKAGVGEAISEALDGS